MARGNPNFKKEKKAVEPANEEVKDQLTDQEVKTEVKVFKPEEITDQTIIDDFGKLSDDLLAVMSLKAANRRPSRHYFAISQQVQMWGRNFLKSCDTDLKARVKFGK